MAMLSKSFESFIATVNSIIAEHAPLRKISIKERKKSKALDHKRHTNLNQQQKQNIWKVLPSKKPN